MKGEHEDLWDGGGHFGNNDLIYRHEALVQISAHHDVRTVDADRRQITRPLKPSARRRESHNSSCSPLCLVRTLQRGSALAAKSGNRSWLTRDVPPKDLTRKVSRCLLVIQAIATHLSIVQP